ncbi:hypothetical protein [Longimicrobium sp.]|uniref:hypothetical protein n=1 Tax=Longimicrobium sp. TaxID=2029185 RepID=UPI003B3B9F82
MSEYQYYEFQAVDRPLTETELREVRAYSTRARITPTSFVNEYNWGDFKGQPAEWMERWYDAFLYLANWGSHELMLRVPADTLDAATLRRYRGGDRASARVHGDVVILSFSSDDEDHDWWEEGGNGWLASILPLRGELACGDLRALYLGWLLAAQDGELDDDEPEPPVPPGLKTLSGALKAFADFLRLDSALVQVAAQNSAPMTAGPDETALPGWIAALPEAEKTELLVRVAGAAPMAVRSELLHRFRMAHRTDHAAAEGVRTVGELLEAADRIAEERSRIEAEQKARERKRREREAAAARALHLDGLSGRDEELWDQVDCLVPTKQPQSYDQAVSLLKDLRDLAIRDRREPAFAARLQGLRNAHAKKSSFLDRLRKALG